MVGGAGQAARLWDPVFGTGSASEPTKNKMTCHILRRPGLSDHNR